MLFGRQFLLRLLPLSPVRALARSSSITANKNTALRVFLLACCRAVFSIVEARCTYSTRSMRSLVRAAQPSYSQSRGAEAWARCQPRPRLNVQRHCLSMRSCKSQRSLNSTEMWDQWCRMCAHSSEMNSEMKWSIILNASFLCTVLPPSHETSQLCFGLVWA